MKIKAYKRFQKAYKSLSKEVQNKIDKQIEFLSKDFKHPSLYTKKIKGAEGIWEIRLDIHHRLILKSLTIQYF